MAKRRRLNTHLLVRINVADRRALNRAAAAQDIPTAQVVRKAIKAVVSEIEAQSHGKPAA